MPVPASIKRYFAGMVVFYIKTTLLDSEFASYKLGRSQSLVT